MYIAVWWKGPNSSIPYIGVENSGKTKELATLDDAKKYVEGVIAANKLTNFDVMILDTDKHEVASWAAAIPPALQWNQAVTATPTK